MATAVHTGLAARIGSAVADHQFTGVVHVAAGGEPVFARAYGLADRAAGVPNTIDTRFGTASATKFVTALGIGALVDDGRLALSTGLVDVVSAPLPGVDPAVTIGALLSHTSGVYDYYDEDMIDDFDAFELPIPPATLLRPSDYLPMLTGPQKFAPGTGFSYSNGGYVMLGLVIEELTGSFHDHLDARVLRPAAMDRSGFFRFDRLPPGTATGYCDDGTGGADTSTNVATLPVIGGPDGGMFTTVGDVARLWRAFLSGEIVSPALVETFTTKVSDHGDGEGLGYGHGLWLRDRGDLPPILFVEGCDAGVSIRSSLYRQPAPAGTAGTAGTVVTVVSNSTDGAWAVDRAVNGLVRDHLALTLT